MLCWSISGTSPFDDAPRQPFGDRGLANAGFPDQQRVILAPPAQRLHHALQFAVAADQRVDLARQRHGIEIERVALERAAGLGFMLAFGVGLALRRRGLRHLADAVRNEVHDIEPGHALLVQEVDRVGILLAENRDQHVGPGHFLLARRLHVQDGALDHALEAERGLGIDLVARQDGRVLGHEIGKELPQIVDVRGTGAQHFGGRRIVEQGQQQMLHGNKLVAFLPRLHEGHMQADFEFLCNHLSFLPSHTVTDVGAVWRTT